MLDHAFLNVVGAGLTTLAPAYNLTAPKGSVLEGRSLLDSLLKARPEFTQKLITSTVSGIWQTCKKSGFSAALAESNLSKLPQLLERNRPDADQLIAASAIAQAAPKLGPESLKKEARSLATHVLDKAASSKDIESLELDEDVTKFFLEALFTQLLTQKPNLDPHHDLMDQHWWSVTANKKTNPAAASTSRTRLPNSRHTTQHRAKNSDKHPGHTNPTPGQHPPTDRVSTSARATKAFNVVADKANAQPKPSQTGAAHQATITDTTPPKTPHTPVSKPATAKLVALANETGIPVQLLQIVERTIFRLHDRTKIKPADVNRSARLLATLLQDLQPFAHATGADAAFRRTYRHVMAGELAEAEIELAEVEEGIVDRAKTTASPDKFPDAFPDTSPNVSRDAPRDTSHGDAEILKSAIQTRRWRGEIQEILCNFRRAARHYAFAIQHLARDDYQQRWTFTRRQIAALHRAATVLHDDSAKTEATQLCMEAIQSLPEERAAKQYNQAVLVYAKLHRAQSSAPPSLEQFDKLNRMLQHAQQFFENENLNPEVRIAKSYRADICCGIAEHKGDIDALYEAINTHKDLVKQHDPENSQKDWRTILRALRAALYAIDTKIGLTSDQEQNLTIAIASLEDMAEAAMQPQEDTAAALTENPVA